ncbi:hypothetical protein QE197_14400 [Arsenophonus nasoniae]|uniref:Uncharacterized protein n=1 Tax=Arsenophonus nasoniae TaxID=638 RepID=A0A4P7KXH4_9GAMM|nr:hypothetical protein [Arsenophonus nasoniae]QBY44696.1 hypothetical protein ArsFIN_32820 [Arsenophonus nasoniae]WGL94537.1 hypothetical protein QE207_12550 [Arsenophonus nasoniae]WGM00880.1 hypothetical protein QE210_13635 [Arsenophonus nasoniae]WGM04926.1 hypothetical protein QE258_15245 [Arsenophonus nasoniae]WGM10024.1 hypothetical protein QE197_14400 [Arsenophonus nasoniae]
MKSLLKTAIVTSFLAFSSFSIANTNIPWQCTINTFMTDTAKSIRWQKENCLPPSNESTPQTSNEINISNTHG